MNKKLSRRKPKQIKRGNQPKKGGEKIMLRINQPAQGDLQDLLQDNVGVGVFECQSPTGQHYQVIRPSEGVALFLDTSKAARTQRSATTFEQPWTIKKISELPTIQLAGS